MSWHEGNVSTVLMSNCQGQQKTGTATPPDIGESRRILRTIQLRNLRSTWNLRPLSGMLCIGMHQRVQWLAEVLVLRVVGTVAVEAWPVRPPQAVRVAITPILPVAVEVVVGGAEEAVVEEGAVVVEEGAVVVAAVVDRDAVVQVAVANSCTIAES